MDFRIVDHLRDRDWALVATRVQRVVRVLAPWGRLGYRWRWRLATIGVALIAVQLGFHVYSGPNGWIAYQQKKQEHQKLQQQVEQLQQGNEELERHVKALKSDPHAIEKEAREQLRYVRPGEIIYVMPDAKPATPPRAGK